MIAAMSPRALSLGGIRRHSCPQTPWPGWLALGLAGARLKQGFAADFHPEMLVWQGTSGGGVPGAALEGRGSLRRRVYEGKGARPYRAYIAMAAVHVDMSSKMHSKMQSSP